MKPNAAKESVNAVTSYITNSGLQAHLSEGTE
ncbi:MAG: hypothetical protein PHE02_14455, partial [Lachnospiraceae bacterium]|nr:hypothetical protein [Lachnospiraceae bacterium]